jgi:dGTPase
MKRSGQAKRAIGSIGAVHLPPRFQARIEKDGLHRVVCDYISGMTDRFALDEHRKLFDPLVRV